MLEHWLGSTVNVEIFAGIYSKTYEIITQCKKEVALKFLIMWCIVNKYIVNKDILKLCIGRIGKTFAKQEITKHKKYRYFCYE